MALSCRLCLAADPGEKLRNVFQCNVQHVEDSLVDVLFWVFSVQIDVTDPFSKDICSECIQLIEYILQVKKTFQKNQENLRRYLQNENCNLHVQSLDDDSIKKVSDIERRSSSSFCTSPTHSPSKSRYNSKIYGNSSPRVRVSLSSIEAMCPISINLVQLENTQEYLRYRRLKNGSFKRRKYRHFNMDGALLDDICNTLENKSVNTESLRKEIGVSTELPKAINTNDRNVCTCYKNITSPITPLNPLTVENPSRDYLTTDTTEKEDDFLDIIGLTKSIDNTFLSPEGGREYDWTTLTFKKDASTNTKSTTPTTRDIGINATVHSTTTGTLTKRFKQMKKNNIVKVNIDSLESFCPEVVLEPLEDILDKVDYKKIDTFRYIKRSASLPESGTDDNVEHDDATNSLDNSPNCVESSKKQKFLDYYKNFSSFAVRELITGKKIRENETSPVFKIANVCSVFVCDFCSKSFLSNISLDLHYKRAHKARNELDDVVIVDLVDSEGKTPIRSRKSIHIRRKRSGENTETVKSDNVVSVDCTSEGHTETPTNDKERQSENCSSNDSVGKKNRGLRNIAQKINYNLNDIMRRKTKGKQIPLKIKRRTGKLKRLGNMNMMSVNKDIEKKKVSYIWDRKRLGKYSAISYYKNYSGEGKPPLLNLEKCDVQHKQDIALNETIQKLANRLDNSCTSNVDSSDKVEGN